MWFTWGALVLLTMYGTLELSGTVDFSPTAWLVVGVAAAMSVAADVLRRRRPVLIEVTETDRSSEYARP